MSCDGLLLLRQRAIDFYCQGLLCLEACCAAFVATLKPVVQAAVT